MTVRREERAWELSIKGFSYRQIASILTKEQLGPISFQAVGKLLGAVAARLREGLTARAEDHRIRQEAYLIHCYNVAMREWYRSRKGARQISQKTNAPASGPPAAGPPAPLTPQQVQAGRLPSDYTLTVLREECGDPQYLRAAMEALRDLRKLLGLDAPDRQEFVGGAVGGCGTGRVVIVLPHNGRDPLPRGVADHDRGDARPAIGSPD